MAKKRTIKKQGYHLYQGSGAVLINHCKKELGAGYFKKDPILNVAKYFMEVSNGEVALDSNFHDLSREYAWEKEGKPAIFPQSPLLLETLINSKFMMKNELTLDFPFKHFTLAMPKGIEIQGMEMPGILVSSGKYCDIENAGRGALISKLNPSKAYIAEDETEVVLISFKDPNSNEIITSSLNFKELLLVLQCQNYEQYKTCCQSIVSKYDDAGEIGLLTGNDPANRVLFNAFRIVASVGVYMAATNNEKLKKGLPGSHVGALANADSIDRPGQVFLLEETPTMRQLRNSPEGHYRGFHFRNLRHEKYYQNEHNEKPHGSRWTFVSDSLINDHSDPHTMEM